MHIGIVGKKRETCDLCGFSESTRAPNSMAYVVLALLSQRQRKSEMLIANLKASLLVQVSYSTFMHGLKEENIQVNRKVLSELAMQEPYSFKSLVDQVRFMRGDTK